MSETIYITSTDTTLDDSVTITGATGCALHRDWGLSPVYTYS
jgi:hypothetical protein